MQFVENVNEPRITVGLHPFHNLFQRGLKDPSWVCDFGPILKKLDFNVGADEVVAVAKRIQNSFSQGGSRIRNGFDSLPGVPVNHRGNIVVVGDVLQYVI